MSILTSRYSGSSESKFDHDIRQVNSDGFSEFFNGILRGELSDSFWNESLPQALNSSVTSSPFFKVFLAAQVKLGDKGLLSRDITVLDLIRNKYDVHHIFPKAYLQQHGMKRGMYNQIANFAITQSEINIAIGKKDPGVYFSEMFEACAKNTKAHGNITNLVELRSNLESHCIPEDIVEYNWENFESFLNGRRKLMSLKIKKYFETI